jgi:hypothetical protein
LRVHTPLLDRDEEAEVLERADAKRAAAEAALGPEYPVGDPKLHIEMIDGVPYGIEGDEEPDNKHIDTGNTIDDFADGDLVWAWWWHYWWQARVQYVAVRKKTLTLRWIWNTGVVSSGYLPRLCMHPP